jgi:hypothetical protein
MKFIKGLKKFNYILTTFWILISITLISSAATYDFNPASETFPRGCVRSVNLEIDASGQNSNAADVIINYDASQVEIIDQNSSIPGVQVQPGNAYESYFFNQVTTSGSTGEIRVGAGSFISNLTSKKNFATIVFKSEPTATTVNFNVQFTGVGDTLDSNIADTATSLDLLNGVTNGTYSFVNGPCVADTEPPKVNFQDPTNGSNFPVSDDLTFRITDNQSGVDLDSLVFTVNGVDYQVGDPEVSYTGDPLNYQFTIDPGFDLPEDESSSLRVKGQDEAGNEFNRQIVFNIPVPPPPPTDDIPPQAIFINPEDPTDFVETNED